MLEVFEVLEERDVVLLLLLRLVVDVERDVFDVVLVGFDDVVLELDLELVEEEVVELRRPAAVVDEDVEDVPAAAAAKTLGWAACCAVFGLPAASH